MSRVLGFIYGVVSYLLFFAVFLYFIFFVGDIWVPKTISSGTPIHTVAAIVINLGLIALFGVQHSVMARPGFKAKLTKMVPQYLERSTYVLASTVALGVVVLFWQPMPGIIWDIEAPTIRGVIWAVFLLGWGIIFLSTFLTDHFDLFGLRQVYLNLLQTPYTDIPFTERLFYKHIRHPMMLGILIAFWAVPTMTLGHLIFSLGMSGYVFLGIHFEEQGLLATLGEDYRAYRERTAKIFPWV